MQAITYAYKEKKIDGNLYHPIVKRTGEELVKGVNTGYGILQGVDFDSPDYVMREYLKKNIWKFSVAKNYNDCIRISNLLIRQDGSLRPWNEFKKEAFRVVGDSNRYLKTEYDTIVASAQMSRLWNEIQRDKHIFPFVQFLVVMDGHTSEICSPLHNVIVKVDDPKLAYYFPPNHFNCRTTVKKLRSGRVTQEISWPIIPEAFQNNPGETGLIFTDKNAYIENTPEKLLSDVDYYKEDGVLISSKAEKFSTSATERERQKLDFENRKQAAKVLNEYFENQKLVSVLPEIRPDHWAYDIHFEGAKTNKVPDIKVNNEYWEVESYEGKFKLRKIGHMLHEGYKQADNIIIKLNHFVDVERIKKQIAVINIDAKTIIAIDKNGNIIYISEKKISVKNKNLSRSGSNKLEGVWSLTSLQCKYTKKL